MEESSKTVCGIYIMINIINWKVYIGQSIDIYHRFKRHEEESKDLKRKGCDLLNKSIRKYGIENFKLGILEKVDPSIPGYREKLNKLEIYYISLFKSRNHQFGYNITPGGSGFGSSQDHPKSLLNEEQVFQIREMLLSGYNRGEAYKEFLFKNKNLKLSLHAFSDIWKGYRYKDIHYDVYNLSKRDIQNLRFKRKYGVDISIIEEIMKYKENGKTLTEVFDIYKSIFKFSIFRDIFYERIWKIPKKSSNKPISVVRINPKTGETRVYDTISLAALDNNIHTSTISNVCKGIRKTCNGFIWKYKD